MTSPIAADRPRSRIGSAARVLLFAVVAWFAMAGLASLLHLMLAGFMQPTPASEPMRPR